MTRLYIFFHGDVFLSLDFDFGSIDGCLHVCLFYLFKLTNADSLGDSFFFRSLFGFALLD